MLEEEEEVSVPSARPRSPFCGRMLKPETLKQHREWEQYVDALLADLQNTVSSDTGLIGSGGSTPGYGSLNGIRGHGNSSAYKNPIYENHTSTSPLQSQSPTYQNREAIEEAAAARTAVSGGGHYNPSGTGTKMPSLNNNLSELDTLLQDLSNARYNSHAQDRDVRSVNGGSTSPMLRSASSLSATRPSVDTLLEELGTGMTNGDYPTEGRVKVTIEETSTEVQPAGDEAYYSPIQHHRHHYQQQQQQQQQQQHQHHPHHRQDSLSRREVERSYHQVSGNGHTASNATKELDDLMASLSEFKINGGNHQRLHQQQPNGTATNTITTTTTATTTTSSVSTHRADKAVGSFGVPLATSSSAGAGPPPGSPPPPLQQQQQQQQSIEQRQTRVRVAESLTTTTHHCQPRYESHTASAAQSVTHVVSSSSSGRHQNQLDSMLGNLQADMSRQGVNTTQKGCCSACEKPIVGQVITALGKTWHPEHFTCAHCNQELGTRNFFEREARPYCETDYHNLFSPRCAYCNGPILDKCVTALEKTWHTEHFFCAQCGKQFGEEGFHERDGKPYCRDDYFDMFAPKCGGCNRAIMENYISALNSQWHPDCFVCRDCKKPVSGKSFYAMEGKPLCPKCVGVDDEEEEEEEEEA